MNLISTISLVVKSIGNLIIGSLLYSLKLNKLSQFFICVHSTAITLITKKEMLCIALNLYFIPIHQNIIAIVSSVHTNFNPFMI